MVLGDQTPAKMSSRRRLERRLAALLAADIMGYSALMERSEEETHREVGVELERFRREIERSHGRIFSFAGDGLMAEFPSAVEALKCSLRVQADAGRRNSRRPTDRRIIYRIGINSGEIVLHGDRTGGTAVNIAARLEQIAEPGGICLSGAVFEQVRRIVPASYQFSGERRLKNIRDPVPTYGIAALACGSWAGMPDVPRLSRATPGTPAHGAVEYRPSLAVLPFRTFGQDRSDAYFAEGMVDDIISALGGLKDLIVIARNSTQTYAGAPLDLRRVGHDLDVRYVVHGSVRRSETRLRIAVELAEAQTGTVIWGDRLDGAPADIFDLQDRIAARVATSIAPHLRELELRRILRKHPASLTAYDLTLQALDQINRLERQSLEQARRLLEQAIAIDPDYGPAFSRLAFLHLYRVGQGWSADAEADAALAAAAARSAIERDRNDPVALAIYGHIQAYLLKEYVVGADYLDRAIAVGPNCALAWSLGSLTPGYLGDYATAIDRAERGLRLSPLGADVFWFEHFLSQAYYLAGRFDDAVGWARMSEAHNGANNSNRRCLIAALVALGEIDEARRAAGRLLQSTPGFRISVFRARTPLRGAARDVFCERLESAGLPD